MRRPDSAIYDCTTVKALHFLKLGRCNVAIFVSRSIHFFIIYRSATVDQGDYVASALLGPVTKGKINRSRIIALSQVLSTPVCVERRFFKKWLQQHMRKGAFTMVEYSKSHFMRKHDQGCACILSKRSIPTRSRRCFVHHEFPCYIPMQSITSRVRFGVTRNGGIRK